MLNNRQQQKALVLSLLMVMLAQTAYIESYRGWTLGEAASPSHLNAACSSISRPSSTPIYVDASQGSDDWNGTWSCPKATLSEALNDATADDEIVLATGRYHENVTVNNKDNLLIRAADGARVVFDGTLSIADDLNVSWGIADGSGIQETTLPVDGWQLFLSYDEQVPARWPNAQFSDATVFNRSHWAEGTLTGSNNAYTQGWLTDAGPEAGVHTGLNETVNATGLDPVGAIAVMNLGSFRSNSRLITDWNASNGTFAYDGNGVGWKNKHHAYFLEGKRELIDQDGEWWFNNTNNRLHYKTPSGQDANGLDLRVKVQPFAISVENSDGVTIQGIDFFGTTVNFNNCDGCSFTNATLEYPSTSKRGLGIAGESEDDRWMTRFYRSTNSFVDNISITNTDGGAIEFQGSAGQSHNNTVNNSYFHAIDWSAADQKGLMTTIYEGGRDMYFTNNTVHLTGASSVLSIGDAPKVFYNEVWDVGHLQTDGAVVQIMQGEAPGAEVAYNWIHDIIKYGIRFDAPIGQIGQGRNGTMHHNVIWNAAGGLMVKGDYHDIHNNTVFNSSASKNDIIALTDGGINNKNSTFHRNAVDSMADHRSDDVHDNPLPNGTHWSNWNGYLQGYDDMYEPRNQLSCAIYDNGSLYCWGRNDHGQLGLGYTSGREEAPQYVDLGTGRTITSLGIDDSGAEGWAPNSHSCAVLDNGELLCWGANDDGQLGLGNTTSGGVWEPTTVNVGSGLTTLSVAVGNGATCALLSDHSVKCWGKNNHGQLGLGNTSSNDVLTPHTVTFTGSSTPISLHAGRIEFCARLDNGSAACWGANDFGQFGLGNSTAQNTPIPLSIPTGRTITSMSVSKEFMCLSLDNGSVVCAGKNNVYQLGTGATSTQETTWQYVADLDTGVHSVELAAQMGCAHLVNGSMVCWGKDEWGLFGNDVASAYGSPHYGQTASEYVNFGAGRTAASIGLNFRHACAVLDNGDLTCWGRNHRAQLGLGNTTQQYQPVVVSNVSSLRQLAVHEMLVDSANDDFRPKWGSPLQQLSAGAYDAGDADPWTAGVSWTYSPMSDPVSGCMNSLAINYNSNAVFSDGSCTYTALSSSSSTLSLEVGVAMTPHTLTYSTPFLEDDKQTAASSGAVGEGPNVALDSNGAVHICSKTVTSDDLYYTTNASGSWQSVTIDSTGNVGGDCFIILDSDDDIHITYRDDSNNNLKYATKALSSAIASSNWAVSTMDNNGNVGNFGSMAVDANDTLHVAYYSSNGASLKYATLADASTTWSREVVESTNDVGKYTSIALDSNGNPHITYYDDTNNDLRYTHKMGSSWTFTTLDSTAHTGKGTSLAIDSNDHLHVAYKTNSTEIAYMTNRSGSWVKTTLDANSTGNWGVNYINIMLDEGDDPHVVYSDMVDYDIFYMSNTRGTWERIHVAGDSISKSSEAAMDENGGIHVAYHIDGSFDDVGYAAVRSLAHRPVFEISPDLPQGLSLGAENGTVFGTPMEHLDQTEFTVWANTTRTSAYATFSMNVDWELQASIDWMEVQRNTAITPITFNWTAWSSGVVNATSSVYTSGNSGLYNDIVVDSNEKVHIVFYRDDNTNLYHSTNASGTWVTSSIDTNQNVGKYCSIAIDSNDGLHVSYQYNTGNTLKYAYKSAGSSSWSKATVDNTGGKFTAIAVDSNDKPHIVYRDGGGNGGDLAYAKKTGNSWSVSSPVYSAGDVAATSIAIDSNDHVHIAYYDANNKDMYHLTNTSGSWARTFLEDIGTNTGGTALDIAIDPTTDEPGISYFDMGATSLKYTYYTGSAWSATTVENSADYGRFNSIVYDSVGNVHISHERNSADDLYYTSDKTGSWVSTPVDTTNSVGTYTAIAVDENDDVHIAYRYNTGADLYVATVQGHNTGSVSRTDVAGATCSISPSLPFGLTLNQGTCTISGTPTSHSSNITYNVTATSSSGVSKSGEFKMWITPMAPSIAYTGSPFTFTQGTPIASITPSNTGDSAFWSVSPALPSGLTLGPNGVISGTPSAEASAANYTITASNPGGESSATVSITVTAQPPSGLSYATENMTLTQGVAMTVNNPSVGGGSVSSWDISPTLPSGLTLSSTTGAISGTPSNLQITAVTYTVWANNSGGSSSTSLNITITAVGPSSLSYTTENMTLTKGLAMSANTASVSGGTVTSWEIYPALPSGLSLDSLDGEITGTPTVLQTTTVTYTVWANNSGGSASTTLNITINDASPNTIMYGSHDLTLQKGTAMITTTPAIGGGAATSWAISPSIPNGMAFSSTTGAISGTPSVLQTSAVTYTIWANNSGGSTSTQMNITINDQIASVTYPSTVEVSNDRTMTTVTPTNTGGAVTSWVIVPSLPSGLNFGTSNGSIWGTPSGLLTNATYTVYANNSGGSTSTTFTLGLNWTLTPSAEGAFITRNMSLSPDITWTINPSGAVSGATCAISPSLPAGLSLTASTCAITGTPTDTANNATYTVWANISGTSYSGQVWLEVGLNAPNISYSSSSFIYTKDIEIFRLNPANVGGEATTWAINATLPSGLSFGTSNGTIWGTPDTVTAATTYTIWANNSAGSNSTTITITVNDPAPNFYYGGASGGGFHPVVLYLNQTMNAIHPTMVNGSGAPTSCSSSPSLPSGITLSSSCVISGTPNATDNGVFYTITGTNTGGSDAGSVYILIRSYGGALTITPTNREGSVNSTLSNITMSYTHSISNYGWTSGVSNTTTTLTSGLIYGSGNHWLGVDSGEQGEMAVVFAHNDTGASTHSLALMYRWNGAWTETVLDNGTDTGQHPSVAIDRQGALHIAYIDDHNDKLRYATNASGSWVFLTLGVSSYDNDGGRGTAIVVHPITDAVHIVTTIYENSSRDLQHHTNEGGSWVNETITNTSKDEGHDPSMVMDGDGNLYVAHYCDNGCSDLRMSSRINGVWQNETIAGVANMHGMSGNYNIGTTPEMAIDSQGTLHIVSQRLNSKNIYLHSGTPGNWYENRNLTGTGAHWPAVAVDSNDAVHITYHVGTNKDMMYLTNASGSWPSPASIYGYGGWGSVMHIDANDDVFIPNNAPGLGLLQMTTVKGSGQGLTVRPIYDVSPMLPDGLTMNWRTGTISGTPTETHTNTTHTVTVTALGTTTTATFTLLVTGVPGDISYANISGTKGSPIVPVSPSFSNGSTSGSVTSWAINATPPGGLSFDTSTGVISGTPTVVVVGAVFTVWANNSAGSTSTTVNITVNDVAVSSFTYTAENSTLTLYHTMATITATTTGGTPTSWGIHPALPSGLTFNTVTGAISGTPEVLQTTTVTYTVWANNSGGSFSDQINITVNDHPPVPLNYFGGNITLNFSQTMSPLGGFELKPDVLSAGEDHTCAIRDDGRVLCWGEGAFGRLGIGNQNDKSSPQFTNSLGSGRQAIDVSAGGQHTCAVLDNGSVMCWGRNNYGQIGDGNQGGNRLSPTHTVALPRPAVAVEAGMDFSCALLDNGSVMCWGRGADGRLGNGGTSNSAQPVYTDPIPGGRKAVAIDISHYHTCAVLDDGSVACWGTGGAGRLGTGSTSDRSSPTLANYLGSTNQAVDVALGRYTGCALMSNGSITCWGYGYLGDGNGENGQHSPGSAWVNLPTGRTAVAVEMGRKHACMQLDDGVVMCWGDDEYGQLANGNGEVDRTNPRTVNFASGIEAVSIHAGHWHNCITAQTNEVYCWGDGQSGKLGDGASTQHNFAGAAAKTNHFSGSKPVLNFGNITTWAIHPTLPAGLSLGSTNGTLWGAPTASIPQTNFTVYGNNSGGSSSFVLNLGVNLEAPGPFQYIPENSTWTNNTEVHLAPQFINQTTGNGSTWQAADIASGAGLSSVPGAKMAILVGNTMYFDADGGAAGTGRELWAYDISNDSAWLVANINSGSYSNSWPGQFMSVLVGDTIYFDANDGSTGRELWAHDTSNHSTWRVTNINSSASSDVGTHMHVLVGDTIYFNARDGYDSASTGTELWAHDTSNHSTWRVADINSGATSSSPGVNMAFLIGDTLYFDASGGGTTSNRELWAHDTSNHSTWQVADISTGGNGNVGLYMSTLVGDTLYFSASDGSTGTELWAHDTSNHSTWQAANINFGSGSSMPGQHLELLVGDTLYFSANDGSKGTELWAHDTSNHSTWRVADINNWIMMGGAGLSSNPGEYMAISVGDTIYFSAQDQPSGHELWAHDTSNHSTWQVADIRSGPGSGSFPGQYMEILIGDTLYFSADDGSTGYELWAHDTSNHSTWQVDDLRSGPGSSDPGQNLELLVGDTLYFAANDGSTGYELWAHRPLSIDYNTNTGGNVTTWAINASLPSGVSFGTNNGTIYGTPTELWPQTSYMVWANNSGGSSVAYLNITVVEELANIAYNPSNVTIVRGYTMANISANNTGGAVVSWSISPTLPTGLSFANGTIYGRPLSNMSATTYTVYANNSGGSATATLTLTINEPTPNVDYSPDNYTLTNGTSYTITPTLLGQTGNISSILGAGTLSSSGACTYGNLLIFRTNDWRMWAFNTTLSASTSNPYVLTTGISFSSCTHRLVHNGTMYFQASTNTTGNELWKTDGTAAGTSMVKDIVSGTSSSSPSSFFVFNDEVHFSSRYTSSGVEIWKTNGTSSGTVRANAYSGCYVSNCNFHSVIEYNGSFYGGGHWNSNGREVLMYNSSGLSLLVDLSPGQRFNIPRMTNPSNFVVHDGWLWFLTGGNPQTGNGYCLYRSNGTAAGTTSFVCDTGKYGLELFNDELYFSRSANGKGYELWKTDGTTSGTVMVKDVNTGSGSALGNQYGSARLFTSTDDYLYFSVQTGTANTDHAVWRTDGTTAGTQLVKSGLVAYNDVVIGNVLYIRGTYYVTTSETISGLWSTDGTTNGTTLYTNYDGDFPNPYVGDLHNINGSLYFQYYNGTASTYGQMNNAAGAIIGQPSNWSISPSLPAGLNFGTNNGTIWGTPTALSTTTWYNITATNANGSSTTSINITINDQLPSLSYTPENLTLTIGQSSTDLPLNATLTGSGEITSWEINATLPAGLNFGTSNGTIWGVPTVLQTTATTYTVWANNSGGSTSATINITINDEAPGPFEYIPENNIWTNNSYVNIGPSFINITTGNGSSWQINQLDPTKLAVFVGDVVYINGPKPAMCNCQFGPLTALNTSNGTSWQVLFTVDNGERMSFLLGDVIYFDAFGNNGTELWAYNTSNNTGWMVSDINNGSHSNPGEYLSVLVGDTIYFSADDGSSGVELWAHNTTNGTTWQVADIWSGTDSGLIPPSIYTNKPLAHLIGDTVYFAANDGNDGTELWAHNTSNLTTWQVADISPYSSNPGSASSIHIGDTIYFNADDYTRGNELWAHNASNHTTWLVSDINPAIYTQAKHSYPGIYMPFMLTGEAFYFSADGNYGTGFELYAHNVSNHSTWLVADIFQDYSSSSSNSSLPGENMAVLIGDTLYFDARDDTTGLSQLWAHDTSNRTTWKVHDASAQGGSMNAFSVYVSTIMVLGDTLYFGANLDTAYGVEMWAHDTSNQSTWLVSDQHPVHSFPGYGGTQFYHNGTMYFSTLTSGSGHKLWAHSPLSINHQTNTGGAVTSWAINGSLPSGVSFNTQTGVLSGTPTELWPQTTYMVWANNSGGSSVAYLNITVVDELPTLAYTPTTLTLTLGQQSSDLPLNATLTGSGDITSWEINATLPTGLNFGTSNGTIWGIPAVLQTTATTYTIWANNSGGSSVAYLNITINDEPPGPFEYIPENNTWTNNSYVNIGPSFINITTGNNSNWLGSQVRSGSINIGLYVEFVVGDVIYFDESYGGGHLYAYNTSNNTAWRVFETMESQTVYDVGEAMSMIAGDIIYFSGDIWSGGSEKTHLYAHNTSNGTTWRVPNTSTYHQGVNLGTEGVVLDDTIYFAAGGGSLQIWGFSSVNNTAWQATSTFHGFGCCSNLQIVGDTIYYTANRELWAYNTSNQSDWEVAEINPHHQFTSDPGRYMSFLVGDTMYFDADDGSTGRELWAYNTSNETYWRVVDISNGPGASNPGSTANILVGDTIYFNAYDSNTGYTEMWAYTTSNVTTWKATDLNSQTGYGNPGIGVGLIGDPVVIGDTIFFDAIARDSSSAHKKELWAHDTSNHSTWQVSNLSGPSSSNQIGSYVFLGLGDTLYFSNTHSSISWLWAYDTTNQSVWNTSIRPGDSLSVVVGNTIYLEGSLPISNSFRLIAHQPGSVNHQTNTGGNVITWAINASLPSGVSFNNQTGMISGTPTELWPQTSYMVWANNSGGSSVAYLNITVIDRLPTSVMYASANVTLVRGEVSTDLPLSPSLTGPGEITSWAINASLPAGLSFGTNNGTIWGVPLVNMTTTTYTVWANNTGGSLSTTINITVLEPIVLLDYNPENMTLIRGVQMATLFPSVSGGNVSSWSISPDLPAGLNFSDGVISGTPTVNMTLNTFTVWANTSGGATSHTLNITILEPSGNLSYSPQNITLTRGLAMADLHPTYSGGVVENWSIHPALPTGLNFSNGVLSGTPSVNMTTTMFTVYANNSGGSAAATINITILEPAVNLLYNPANLTLMRGTTMVPLLPSVSGGNVSEWGIEPALPSGLNFADGVFSGTPAVNMTRTQFTVYANTSGGSAMAWVNITILEPAVDLSYNPYNLTLTRNVSMTPLSPTVSGGDVEVWTIEPALPLGLNFSNGVISGTPEVNMTTTMFTVWANTSGGSASTTVNITVLEPTVDFLYAPNSVVMTRGETANTVVPVFGNDALAEAWGISPALPAGLNFSNGVITGTPEVNMTATVFTVYANNSGGSAAAYLTITVLEPLAIVAYVPENITLTRGEDNASILPLLGGGMVETWTITPALPDGLVFDNGSITGVPLVNSTNITYTVSAQNTGGVAYAYLNITVVEPVAVLSLNHSFLLTRGETYLNATVNNTGGMVATWWIEPALPLGLTMEHGVLFGVAEVNMTTTVFTIYANNSGGLSNVSFTLEVIEPVAIIAYADAEITLVNGITPGRIVPLLAGGSPENWSIEPALPPGLAFVDGYIVGVAETNLSTTTFTVYANNTGGVAIATFNLTVNQPTFYARYLVTRYVLDVNETMDSKPPVYYFGNNQNPVWSISPSLPEGLVFDTNNGRINGTALEPSNETNYTVVVYGEMVPVQFFVIIEVREEAKPIVVESVRNTTEVVQYQLPVIEEVDNSFDMYWICFPLLLVVTLLLAAAINNFLALTSKPQDDEEDNEDDEESEGG